MKIIKLQDMKNIEDRTEIVQVAVESEMSKACRVDSEKFLDADLYFANNSLPAKEIKAGDGLRIHLTQDEPPLGKTVAISLIEDLAIIEPYEGQAFVGVVKLIDKRFKLGGLS